MRLLLTTLALLWGEFLFAQPIELKGTVVDKRTGAPISGASVTQ